MIRALALTVTTVTVLFCGSQHAFAADWLEPGSYPEADSDQSGELHTFGEARILKGIPALEIPDIAGMAPSKSGNGHWLASADGQVFAFGDAVHRGDLGAISVTAPVVDIAVTPDGNGYWLVTSKGIVYAFGTALWRGSLGYLDLQAPIVDLEPVSTGYGYWLTAADGGVFAFGDAEYLGGLANRQLYRPIIDLLSSSDGAGYLLVGADGAVYAYGNARFRGSLANNEISSSAIVAAEQTRDGAGYWLVSQRGKVFTFGNATHFGQMTAHERAPIGAFAVSHNDSGYWMVTNGAPEVPENSGDGRRIIFSHQLHRVWLVEDGGSVAGTFFVSGRANKPKPGAYQVFSKSRHTIAGHDDIRMEYMVRFTWGVEQAIGFHNIPIDGFGEAMQSEAQLGTYRSEGCVRLRDDQAAILFNWAKVGTDVVVVD